MALFSFLVAKTPAICYIIIDRDDVNEWESIIAKNATPVVFGFVPPSPKSTCEEPITPWVRLPVTDYMRSPSSGCHASGSACAASEAI